MTFKIEPVGHVRGGKTDPDDDWGGSVATIELNATQVLADALAGLDAFSHAKIISCSTGCRKTGSSQAHAIREAAPIGR